LLVPKMTSEVTGWLAGHVPSRVEDVGELDRTVAAARHFEGQLISYGWTQENTLSTWCDNIGRIWGQNRRVEAFLSLRSILRSSPPGRTSLVSSPGAITYENVSSSPSQPEWWQNPPLVPQRKSRSAHSDLQRTYECTVLPTPLLALLTSLLQESCTLPATISPAREMYPGLISALGALFRATGVLYAESSPESPVRLINDCGYLAGEIGLLGLGMQQVGYPDLGGSLMSVSAAMDLSGASWREQYLVWVSWRGLMSSVIWCRG
jgi:hypothetical protein